jgi:hypothetical protein
MMGDLLPVFLSQCPTSVPEAIFGFAAREGKILAALYRLGAGRGNRTPMVLLPADFESAASTNSAIPAIPIESREGRIIPQMPRVRRAAHRAGAATPMLAVRRFLLCAAPIPESAGAARPSSDAAYFPGGR